MEIKEYIPIFNFIVPHTQGGKTTAD